MVDIPTPLMRIIIKSTRKGGAREGIEEQKPRQGGTCDEIDDLFAETETMGMQSDYYSRNTTAQNTLFKHEVASGIVTTDAVDWSTTTARWFVYNDAINQSGFSEERANPREFGIYSEVARPGIGTSGAQTKTWITPW